MLNKSKFIVQKKVKNLFLLYMIFLKNVLYHLFIVMCCNMYLVYTILKYYRNNFQWNYIVPIWFQKSGYCLFPKVANVQLRVGLSNFTVVEWKQFDILL